MITILSIIEGFCCLLSCLGMFLCLLAIPIVGGYFFGRILLKGMGLHTATSEEFRGELTLLKIFGGIFLSTVAFMIIMALLNTITGLLD